MLKKDIVVGATYIVKVSGHLVPVLVESVSQYGSGWNGRNTVTGREVHIRGAQKFRRLHTPAPTPKVSLTPAADEHRRLYPEQYNHPLVGKTVKFGSSNGITTGKVLRVFSTRFGLLAAIDTLPTHDAVAIMALTVIE